MSATFQFDLVTPEKLLLSEDQLIITVPGLEGYFGVLPGHAPFVSQLAAGELTLGEGKDANRYAISGGYAELLPTRVTILADQAVLREDIDPQQTEDDRTEAKSQLATLAEGDHQAPALIKRLAFAQVCLELHRREVS